MLCHTQNRQGGAHREADLLAFVAAACEALGVAHGLRDGEHRAAPRWPLHVITVQPNLDHARRALNVARAHVLHICTPQLIAASCIAVRHHAPLRPTLRRCLLSREPGAPPPGRPYKIAKQPQFAAQHSTRPPQTHSASAAGMGGWCGRLASSKNAQLQAQSGHIIHIYIDKCHDMQCSADKHPMGTANIAVRCGR